MSPRVTKIISVSIAVGIGCGTVAREDPDAGSPPVTSDASHSCPEATHSCIPEAPPDWEGPRLVRESNTDGMQYTCGDGYPNQLARLGSGITEPGSCECSCGAASDIECGDALVAGVGICIGQQGPACLPGQSCGVLKLAPDELIRAPSALRSEQTVRVKYGDVVGATCSEPEGTSRLERPRFLGTTRICEPQNLQAGCNAGAVCAPSPPDAGPLDRLCITREGDAECPADSGYSQRYIRYAEISDERTCDTCQCSPPTASCGGRLRFCPTVDCDVYSQTSSTCSPMPDRFAYLAYDIDSTAVANLRCTASPATVTGNAVGTGAVTVCCLPQEDGD